MNDAALVGISQSQTDLLDDAEFFDERNLSAGRDQLVKRVAFDIFHDDEGRAVFIAKVVDNDNIGMLQDAGLRLTVEALKHIGLPGKALGQGLDRNRTPNALILGKVDNSHTAAAQNARDLVLANLSFFDCIHSFCLRSLLTYIAGGRRPKNPAE